METYGTAIFNASGTSILNNSATVNSLFIEKLVVNTSGSGGTYTKTYPNIPGGSYLIVQQTGESFHSYTIGTNGSNQATITFTAYSAGVTVDSTFLVFTKYVVEPSFGFSFTNTSNIKIASSEYVTPEYLGQVSTFSYAGSTTSGSYIGYTFIGNISIAQHNYMLAWALPLNTSANIWYQVDSYVYSNMSANATFTVWALNTVTSFPLPVALIYKVTPLHSGVTFNGVNNGVQLFDGLGNLTFDSSFTPLTIFNIYSDISYTATGGNALGSWGINTNNYTGITFTPAIVFPDSYISTGYGAPLYRLAYAASTSGSTYSLKYTAAGSFGSTSTYSFIGTSFNNLSITMVDTSQQGGTPSFGSFTVPYTPTHRTFTITGANTFVVPTGCTSLNVLLVGGGGAGATSTLSTNGTPVPGGAGGGGGQVLNYTAYSVTAGQTITCTVGTAGADSVISGGNSGTITANGGFSATGTNTQSAVQVTSSGGAYQTGTNTDPATTNAGGSSTVMGGGGGAGSGGVGGGGGASNGGTGGTGVSIIINGTTYNVGGGGGGGCTTTAGTASHGGGAGSNTGVAGSSGTANTGGGGGGAGARATIGTNAGGSGGSGLIVCYG